MFFKKKTKQALSVIMCLTLVMSAFINFPVKAKAAEVGKTVIDSIEIDTNLFGIQQMCGPAYLISEVDEAISSCTGPGSGDDKGYTVTGKIYVRYRHERLGDDVIYFKSHQTDNNTYKIDTDNFMSNETLRKWEAEKGKGIHYTAYYLIFCVEAEEGYCFDLKNKPAFSFKNYSGTGSFKYTDVSPIHCNENQMYIGVELKLQNQSPRVAKVELTKEIDNIGAGNSGQFEAKVYAYNMDDGVTWSVSGQKSAGTTIDENGLLQVGVDEPAGNINVIATSSADSTKKIIKEVAVKAAPEITQISFGYRDGNGFYYWRAGAGEIRQVFMPAGSERIFTFESYGKEPGNNIVKKIDYDEYTITPWFSPAASTTGVSYRNGGLFHLRVGSQESMSQLYYTISSKYDPTKNVILVVIVDTPMDIVYDANGGTFTKRLDDTVALNTTYYLPNELNVIPPAGKLMKGWEYDGTVYPVQSKISLNEDAHVIKAVYMDDPFVKQPNSVSFNCGDKQATAADTMISFQFDAPGDITKVWLERDIYSPAGSYDFTHINESIDLTDTITVNSNGLTSLQAETEWLGLCRIRIKANNMDYYSSPFRVETGNHVHDTWKNYNGRCVSWCSLCKGDAIYQDHTWVKSNILYPTETESGSIIYTCSYCGIVKSVSYSSYFTVQPKSIYNKDDSAENNGFSVSDAIKGWSIERNVYGIFNTFDSSEESCEANTYIDFSCGMTGDVCSGEYRIKVELENEGVIYSEPFVVANAIRYVEVWDLDNPIAGETLDYDVAINTNPIYEDAIEKTTIRWYKTDSRFPIALSTAAKAIDGQSYYCEIILTPAEGYAFEPTEFRNYAGELLCYGFSSAKVADDGKLHIVFRPVEAEPRIDRITKDNLVIVPNPIVVGSRLVVNEDVINNADEDIVDGYLNGNVTWVYTSMWGIVSKFRYDNDYEYFTVTSDMRGGSVRCEVYAETGNVAWVSPEISLENVENEAININGASLTMEGQIGVNFFLTIPDVDMELEGAYIYMSYTGDTTKPMKVLLKDGIATENGYKFTFPVAVKELCDKVSLQAYTANGDVIPLTRGSKKKPVDDNIFKYAVIDYLNDVPVYNSGDTKLVAFAESLVNYGAEAQNYFKHNAGTLTSTADYSKVTSATLQPYDATKSGTAITGLKVRGVSLTLESELIMNVAFASTDDVISKVTFKVNGKVVIPVKQTDGMYKIEVPNIAAKDLDEFYTVEYTDGTNTQVVKCCPLGYAYTVLQGSDEGLKTLVKAMYLYNQAANGYFHES